MVKAVDKHARITDVRVTAKSGGRSGRLGGGDVSGDRGCLRVAPPLAGRRAVVVTLLDPRGRRASTPTGAVPCSSRRCAAWGCDVPDAIVVPDGPAVGEALAAALLTGPDLLLTTGGTGLTPTDGRRRPPARSSTGRCPASPRRSGRAVWRTASPPRCSPGAWPGSPDATLVVNLPGSTGGVRDALAVLAEVLPHAAEPGPRRRPLMWGRVRRAGRGT